MGPAELELDFAAHGDNSLGPLQKAEASVLVWESEAGATDLYHGTAWCRVNCTVETERRKEGTMTFSNVPTSGWVSFIFGKGGYSHEAKA